MTCSPARPLALAVPLFLLAATAAAQNYAWSPDDKYATLESNMAALNNLGTDAAGRTMLFDGQMRKRPMLLKEVAFRPVWWYSTLVVPNQSNGLNAARTWSKVSLRVSQCDVTTQHRVSTTFSKNPTSTPALVFQGSVTWPAVSWLNGRAPFNLRFPFRSWWLHDGKKDVCLDFDFEGGRIAGNLDWRPHVVRGYPLSGYETGAATQATSAPIRVVPYNAPSCRNPYSSYVPTVSLYVSAYNEKYYHAPARDSLRLGVYVHHVTGPTITAVGFGVDRKGQAIPSVTCAKLHIDLSRPTWFFASNGQTRAHLSPYLKYYQSYAGMELYGQAIWLESSTKKLKLTQPIGTLVPEMDPLDSPLRFTLYQRDPAKKNGSGQTFWAGFPQPVIRYSR